MAVRRNTQVINCSGRDESGNNTNGLALKNVRLLLAVQAKGRRWWVGAELDRTLPPRVGGSALRLTAPYNRS